VHVAGSRLAGRLLVRPGGAWDRGKTTRGEGGAAPLGQSTPGAFAGEGAGPDAASWLRQRASNERSPGARQMVGFQSTVDSVR
jgi:hypothetical protein